MNLTRQEKEKYLGYLKNAHALAQDFDGSECAQDALIAPLELMDEFIRARNNQTSSSDLEQAFARAVWPDSPNNFSPTIDGIIAQSWTFYDRLKQGNNADFLLSQLEKGGANVIHRDKAMVQTDDGALEKGTGEGDNAYEIKTAPRLAFLIGKLADMGIYTDDLVIQAGSVDPQMMRRRPYILLQIPRLGKEINICDQVGEIPFIGHTIHDPLLWETLSKDQLKAREDISAIAFHSEDGWWAQVKALLRGDAPLPKKHNVRAAKATTYPLDLDLIKESIFLHWWETGGTWPTQKSGVIEYGPYADGKTTWKAIHKALYKGFRGLPGGSSLPDLNAIVSNEQGLDYINKQAQDDLDIDLIKEGILAHRMATGKWPTSDRNGLIKYGPYADEKTKWGAINNALYKGFRGLPGGSSLAALNTIVSNEQGLDYTNHKAQDDLDIERIKKSILAHRIATDTWPMITSGVIKYGPYADGKKKWASLDNALRSGLRGLPGGSSLAKVRDALKTQIAAATKPNPDASTNLPEPDAPVP